MYKQSANIGKVLLFSINKPLVTVLLMLLLFIALVTISNGTSQAQSQNIDISDYSATTPRTSDFGSGSIEFSSVTYNPTLGHLVMLDDGKGPKYDGNGNMTDSGLLSRVYIYEVGPDMIPGETPLRNQEIKFYDRRDSDGDGIYWVLAPDPGPDNQNYLRDFEGIAWVYGHVYAFLSEDTGQIFLVNMGADSNDTLVRKAFHVIDTGVIDGNKGLEGIAYKFDSIAGTDRISDWEKVVFYAVKENYGTTVQQVGWNGVVGSPVAVPEVPGLTIDTNNDGKLDDLSDVYYSNGDLYIVSHKSKEVAQFSITENAYGELTGLIFESSLSLAANFYQAEGITFNEDLSTMVIVSETKGYADNAITLGTFTAY